MNILERITVTPPVFRAFDLLNVTNTDVRNEVLVSGTCVLKWRNSEQRVPAAPMERLCEILERAIIKYETALATESDGIESDVLAEVTVHVNMAKGLLTKQLELLDLQREEKREKLKPKRGNRHEDEPQNA